MRNHEYANLRTGAKAPGGDLHHPDGKGQTINEGICIKCAKELGLKPVDDIMQKMGITDEDLDRMDVEMSELLNEGNLPTPRPIIRRIWRGAPRPLTSGSCSAG